MFPAPGCYGAEVKPNAGGVSSMIQEQIRSAWLDSVEIDDTRRKIFVEP
jgi:hypothetical protein